MPPTLTIATRESPLALWQANHVRQALQKLYPACRVELLGLTTAGDRILDRPLQQVGGKGLFIKELEQALLERRADLAVHSLKDMPNQLAAPFHLAAILPREDPRDALVLSTGASEKTAGEKRCIRTIGTSSLRRAIQIPRWLVSKLGTPLQHLVIKPIRGNLGTRLSKLDAGEFDALVLAAAGLIRLGLKNRIDSYLTPEESLPAPGQGVLAIEVLSERTELHSWLAPLNHAPTVAAVTAERAFSSVLGGNCQTPLAAYAISTEASQGKNLWLRGFVADVHADQVYAQPEQMLARMGLSEEIDGPIEQAAALGENLAIRLLHRQSHSA